MFTVFLAVKRCYCQSPLLLFRTLLSSPLTKRSGKEMEKRVDNLIASSSSRAAAAAASQQAEINDLPCLQQTIECVTNYRCNHTVKRQLDKHLLLIIDY